jgi:hypothetical protein
LIDPIGLGRILQRSSFISDSVDFAKQSAQPTPVPLLNTPVRLKMIGGYLILVARMVDGTGA